MNIFDCALKMEEQSRQRFEQLAMATPVPEIKNLFLLLAQAEQEHQQALEAMREKVSAKNAEFSALNEAGCIFRPILAKRDLVAELHEDPDGYQQVVRSEEESIKFYEGLATQAEDEETRAALLMIAAEERRHLSIVENIYSFVESPRTYLAWGEFGNLAEY